MAQSRRNAVATATAAVLLLLASACSGDDDDDSTTVITDPVETTESTTSTEPTTSTTTDPDAEMKAEVEEAYVAYIHAVLEIFATPSPNNPLIDRHTTGDVREETLDAISRDLTNGHSVRPPQDPADYAIEVLNVQVSGDTATIRACVIDGGIVIENSTGKVLNDAVVTLHIEATLRNEAGWKVATSSTIDERDGRWDCGSS